MREHANFIALLLQLSGACSRAGVQTIALQFLRREGLRCSRTELRRLGVSGRSGEREGKRRGADEASFHEYGPFLSSKHRRLPLKLESSMHLIDATAFG